MHNRNLERFKPIALYGSKVILEKHGSLYYLGEKNPFVALPRSTKQKIFSRFKLSFRALRLGTYSAQVHGDTLYLSFDKKIFSISLKNHQVQEESVKFRGHGPLMYASVRGVKTFDDQIVFGEYFGNPSKKSVNIFSKSNNSQWKVAYTFTEEQIEHIHAIVPDRYRDCCWILTGDFGSGASLWKATDNFQKVELFRGNNQIYRSCVLFPVETGLLYATDTQLQNNSIRFIQFKDHSIDEIELMQINGPCIYGHELQDYYIFSTAVEPEMKEMGKLQSLLDNKRAPSIHKNQMDILSVRKKDFQISILKSELKDAFPYRVFQFGATIFPQGSNTTNNLYYYNVATKKDDLTMKTIALPRSEILNDKMP